MEAELSCTYTCVCDARMKISPPGALLTTWMPVNLSWKLFFGKILVEGVVVIFHGLIIADTAYKVNTLTQTDVFHSVSSGVSESPGPSKSSHYFILGHSATPQSEWKTSVYRCKVNYEQWLWTCETHKDIQINNEPPPPSMFRAIISQNFFSRTELSRLFSFKTWKMAICAKNPFWALKVCYLSWF